MEGNALHSAFLHKPLDRRSSRQLLKLIIGGQLWTIPLNVDHAEKTERLVLGRAKLVPLPRRNCHKIELPYKPHLCSHHTFAASAQDHHRVSMFMSL